LYGQGRVSFFSGKLPQNIQNIARKKLIILDAVTEIEDLRVAPGNRLEALKGHRKGQHGIRINDQWRIIMTAITNYPLKKGRNP